MKYTKDQVIAELGKYETSAPNGNRFFNVELNESDSAWNPEGGNFDGPGSATYALYGGGGLYASFSPPGAL